MQCDSSGVARDSQRLRQGKLVVNAYGQTDPGRVRQANQDQFLIATIDRQLDVVQTSLDVADHRTLETDSQGWVLMVADGMGGHAGGAEASALTVEAALRYLRGTVPWVLALTPDQLEEAEETLRTVVRRCHQAVLAAARQQPERRRLMGTTLTMAYIIWPHLFVVFAGDSRCYLLRDRSLIQLTRDHTVAQELVEQAIIRPEQADGSPHAHVLTKVVGGGETTLSPEVVHTGLQDGDRLLLCSDGLTDMLSNGRICRLLLRDAYAKPRCQRLIEAANEAGGTDNITVVVASFEHTGS